MHPATHLLETCPRWQKVIGAYGSVGIVATRDPLLPEGCIYRNNRVALGWFKWDSEYPRALHDLAHWVVTPKSRRKKPNFGLGPGRTAVRRKPIPQNEWSHGTS